MIVGRAEQLDLLQTAIAATHRKNGDKIRSLLSRAITDGGISLVDLAEETGIDEKQLGRSLKPDGGAHPPPALIAAVLAKDHQRVLVTGLCALVGYECQPRRPDLSAENRRLREELASIRTHLDRLLESP